MQSYTIRLDPEFKKEFEEAVERSHLYSNVSEAVRDAMREKAIQLHMQELDKKVKIFADKLKAQGVTAEDIEEAWKFSMGYYPEEREKFAREYAEEIMKRNQE